MDAIFRHDGWRVDYTPVSAVSAGDVVIQGSLVGVATSDIPAGGLGALAVSGVFDVVKASASAVITAGALIYWDGSGATADDDEGSNDLIGRAVEGSANGASTVRVRLSN